MTDADLIALCVWTEARGEPYEGKAAVARVIFNRMHAKWFSDGTVPGTVLAKDQFSGFWFSMVEGHYARVCDTLAQAEARAALLLLTVQVDPVWPDCKQACMDGSPGSGYAPGPVWAVFSAEPRALLYANLSISSPIWATADKKVCTIYSHTFFKP